ncbi:MAG: DUF1493 family protein [Cyclobacteriaceae bacterium]
MNWLDEITNFLEDYTNVSQLNPNSDLFNEHGVVGDDFHNMMDKFATTYNVDMSNYIWYFHSDEEGQNIGSVFFKPPYERVKRIPITPKLLSEVAELKTWNIIYPQHKIPTFRVDILINYILILGFLLVVAFMYFS